MATIYHQVRINAPVSRVYEAMSSPSRGGSYGFSQMRSCAFWDPDRTCKAWIPVSELLPAPGCEILSA